MTLSVATVDPAERRPAGAAGPDPLPDLAAAAAEMSARGIRPRVVLVDAVAVVAAVATSVVLRFPGEVPELAVATGQVEYWLVAAALAAGWIVALWVSGVWDGRILGNGLEEFRRLARASLFLFGVIGVLSYLTKASLARGFIAVALPLGMFALLLSHVGWRRWLVRQRRCGRMLTSVLVVGQLPSASYLARRLQASPLSGYRVAGMCVLGEDGKDGAAESAVSARLADIARTAAIVGARAVAVASCEHVGPAEVRHLAWQLEGTGIRLVLAPSLVDVAGPRIHVSQVAGLPLLQVESPRFTGPKAVVKSGLDIIGATLGLLVLSPLLLAVAVAIRVGDGGPAFFRQTRVGLGGRTFEMWKFRSMHVDAERRLADLRERAHGNGVLFKMKDDPRITPVGRVIRRFSIDELPQLLNVLTRQMSLVGPRPPLMSEVATYATDVHRRFLVKPGMTGLWQVSGRSDLSWEESVRLDLYYVENWSCVGDLIILARTVLAVVGSSGAY